jgi:hypothetical protein
MSMEELIARVTEMITFARSVVDRVYEEMEQEARVEMRELGLAADGDMDEEMAKVSGVLRRALTRVEARHTK